MSTSKQISADFAAVLTKAVKTATGRDIAVEVTMISASACSVLCDNVAALNQAMRFLSCVPSLELDSIAIDPEVGAIAYYNF